MLLRNVNLAGDLWNGIKMIVIHLLSKLIEVHTITVTGVGQKIFIPRMPLANKDPKQ